MAAISVGITDCQARHGAVAWRCTAEPTPSPPSLTGKWNKGEVGSRLMSCDQKAVTSVSNVLASCFGNKAHPQHMLAGSTNMHGEEVVDSLRAETLSTELSECVEAMARSRRVVFSIVACSPRTVGPGSVSPWSVDLTLSSNSWEMGSGQDALHTWILEGWSSRLTDLVEAEIRTSVSVRYCGLTSRQAKSLAPSSSSLQRPASTNRVTRSVAATKPQAERRHP